MILGTASIAVLAGAARAQEAPVSAMVLTEEDLRRNDVNSLNDVLRFDPSLSKFDGPQGRFSQLSIRGVGSLTPGGYEDGSVSAYVDGVPTPFHLIDGLYNDAAQIEVLHGPPGTMFGKDAQAGVLSVATVRPDAPERARISLGFGSRGYGRLTASVNQELIDGKLWGRAFVDVENRGGRVEQAARGEGPGDIRNLFFRGALLHKDDRGEGLLSFSHDRRRNDDVDFTSMASPRVSTYPQDTREDRDTSMLSLNIRRDLTEDLTFQSIIGYHRSKWRYLLEVAPEI